MMTFSHWRTGSSTLKPTRCPSSARAACRTKRHRIRQSPNKTEHLPTLETVTDTYLHNSCAHTVKYCKHQLNAGSESFQERVMDSQFLSSKGCCRFTLWLYILSPGLLPAGTTFFVDNQEKHDFHEKSTFFFPSFLCEETSITCRPKCMGGGLNYGPYC